MGVAWIAFAIPLAVGCGASGDSSSGAVAELSSVDAPSFDGAASTRDCHATIAQGTLAGAGAGTTCEYLGIPYGAPPVGRLRFQPPQPASPRVGVRNATAFGATCIQAVPGLLPTPASEDCLFANVYTPQAAPPQPLPVLVFIHGGAFTTGAGSLYDSEGLSERGPAVIVTINYRLGPLGFLALPSLDAARPGAPSGTDGIRDQQLALRWVKANIAAFHGDPANVTVFGESAGSISACIHLVSPGSQGLASRFILQSGTCVGPPSFVPGREHAYAVGADLVATFCPQLGAGGAGGDLLACLRAADPTRLMEWLPPLNAGETVFDAAPFFPIVDGPGGVLPDTPARLITGGHFDSKAAIVAGTNKNDWGIFFDLATNPALGGSIASPLDITTGAELDRAIDAVFGSIAPQVKAQYPVASDADAQEAFVTLWTDYAFRCPTRELARATTAHGTRSFFLYSYEVGRAYHSDDLLALFDVPGLALFDGTIPSPAFQSEMKGYWTEFAATGRLDGVGGAPAWPSYDATTDRYFALQDPTSSVSTDLEKPQCDFWDGVFASGGQ